MTICTPSASVSGQRHIRGDDRSGARCFPVGQALATARGLVAKSAIKQVDRLLSNAGVAPWELSGSWIAELVGERREIVVAMDWTDFDRDNQCTLALHLVTSHGRATPLLWLTVDKDELKDQRNDFEELPCACPD